MKPKGLTEHDTGMLEFLEDIIGTSRFQFEPETRWNPPIWRQKPDPIITGHRLDILNLLFLESGNDLLISVDKDIRFCFQLINQHHKNISFARESIFSFYKLNCSL